MPSNHFKIGMSNKAAAFHNCTLILIIHVINKVCGQIQCVVISVFFFVFFVFDEVLMNTECFPATLLMANSFG